MTSCAAVDLTAQRTRQSRAQHTQQRHIGDTEGGGAWPSFSWLVVPFRHVTLVLCVHASPSHMISVLSFVSASL